MIAHTIEQADQAETIDRAIVSTDDSMIEAVAREYEGEVPFRRPAELATDEAGSPPVVEHALEWLESNVGIPDMVVMLQVTTPLRTADDIDEAVQKLQSSQDATSLVSVTEYSDPPYWALERGENDLLSSHFDEDVLWGDTIVRSQDLPSLFYPNGAVFAALTESFKNFSSFYTEETLAFEMPRRRSIDIDEPFELALVEKLMD